MYSFIRRHYYTPRTLWPSVYNELRCATGLLPLLEVRWAQPWSTTVGSSDATPHGYAVHESSWRLDDVEAASRWSDKWRFKRTDSSKWAGPRDRALAELSRAQKLGVLQLDAEDILLGQSDAPAPGEDELSALGWAVDDACPELDPDLLTKNEWRLIQCRPYHHNEPVHLKELRAVMFGLRRRVRSIHHHRHSHLFLCDNLGVVLALEKGRCSDPKVLVNLRRWAAYLLGSSSRARVRWVVSELCPSDEDSRRWGRLERGEAALVLRLGPTGLRNGATGGRLKRPSDSAFAEPTQALKRPRTQEAPSQQSRRQSPSRTLKRSREVSMGGPRCEPTLRRPRHASPPRDLSKVVPLRRPPSPRVPRVGPRVRS